MTPSAAQTLVDVLAECGIRRFYTVPGESFLEVIDAVDQHPDLMLVSTRHESGAAFMAEADGKLTRVPAGAMATRGVGASNLAIGVHTAFQDSTPMLALLGQVDTEHLGKEAFQELDLPAFFSQITTWGATAHRADRLAELGAEAFRRATGSRPGPAVLALPADVLPEPGRPAHPAVGRWVEPGPAADDCATIAELVTQAQAPVLVVGRGGYEVGGDDLVRFVERYGVGVFSAFRRQDVFPNEHRSYLGHLTLGTPTETLTPLREADVVVVLGARLDEITTQGFTVPDDGQRVVHVDTDAAALGRHRRVELAVVSSARRFVAGMLAVEAGRDRDWTTAHGAYLRASDPSRAPSSTGINPAEVMAALRRHVPDDTVLVNDAGNFSAFAHRYWRFSHPGTQLGPVSGAMGYGVPGAIGAKLAAPRRRVVALAGDGGFLMTGVEVETAVRVGAPVTVVVFQNGLYGTIAMHQARASGRTAGVDIGNVDVAGFARSLGAEAVTVEHADQLDDALSEVDPDVATVVSVRTDPDVISPATTLSALLETRAP